MTRRPKAPILPEAELGFRRRTARPSAFGFDSRGSSAASPSKDHHGGLLCRPTTPPAPPGSVSDTVEARPESLGHGGLRAACCGLRAATKGRTKLPGSLCDSEPGGASEDAYER